MSEDPNASSGNNEPIAFNQMEVIRDMSKKEPMVSKPRPLFALLERFKDHKNYTRQIEVSKSRNAYFFSY